MAAHTKEEMRSMGQPSPVPPPRDSAPWVQIAITILSFILLAVWTVAQHPTRAEMEAKDVQTEERMIRSLEPFKLQLLQQNDLLQKLVDRQMNQGGNNGR